MVLILPEEYFWILILFCFSTDSPEPVQQSHDSNQQNCTVGYCNIQLMSGGYEATQLDWGQLWSLQRERSVHQKSKMKICSRITCGQGVLHLQWFTRCPVYGLAGHSPLNFAEEYSTKQVVLCTNNGY